jgi:hypothetical protein
MNKGNKSRGEMVVKEKRAVQQAATIITCLRNVAHSNYTDLSMVVSIIM